MDNVSDGEGDEEKVESFKKTAAFQDDKQELNEASQPAEIFSVDFPA